MSDIRGVVGGVFLNWTARRDGFQGFEDSYEIDVTTGALEALAVKNYPVPDYRLVGSQRHDTQNGSYVFFMSLGLEDFQYDFDREDWLRRILNWMEVDIP